MLDYYKYIFPTWLSYKNALLESLTSDSYAQKYPDYANMCNTFPNANLVIVNVLMEVGFDPQDGFEAFIDACLNGYTNIKKLNDYGVISSVVDAFIKKGAIIKVERLDTIFNIKYQDKTCFDNECCWIVSKAILLDAFSKHTINISSYGTWSNITAMYWQNIPVNTDYTVKYKMYLKYCSKYLQTL